MKPVEVVNVSSTHTAICNGLSRYDLLSWINTTLKSNFGKVDELCTGAAYCQLMHSLFPNHVSLKRVKFFTNLENDFFDNFKILQTTFQRLGVQKSIPIERLCKGKFQDNIEFLQWFKKFYEANSKGKVYDPLMARNGEPMGYGLKVVKRKFGSRSKVSSPSSLKKALPIIGTNELDSSPSSLTPANSMMGNSEVNTKLPRSVTKIQLKDNPEPKNPEVEICPVDDSEDTIPDSFEVAKETYSASLKQLKQNLEEKIAENADLRDKLLQMDREINEVREKLVSVRKTRDHFYGKLKDIGSCIKDAEDAGNSTIETMKILDIMLGSTLKDDVDGESKIINEDGQSNSA